MPTTDLDKSWDQIHAMAELAEFANSAKNLAELFKQAVDLVVKHLRFGHAAVFMLNETGDFAVLQAASGTTDELQNLNDCRLPVDSTSLVGLVVAEKQSRVLTDENHKSKRVEGDLFPSSSCEAGFPISLQDQVLGVLYVQHYHSEAFDTDAIATLQSIANLIATFADQHQLFEAAKNKLANAQQQAERERVASAMTAKLWSSTDIHTILRTAIYELCQYLEADEGMIQLHLPDSLPTGTTPANNGHKGGKA